MSPTWHFFNLWSLIHCNSETNSICFVLVFNKYHVVSKVYYTFLLLMSFRVCQPLLQMHYRSDTQVANDIPIWMFHNYNTIRDIFHSCCRYLKSTNSVVLHCADKSDMIKWLRPIMYSEYGYVRVDGVFFSDSIIIDVSYWNKHDYWCFG